MKRKIIVIVFFLLCLFNTSVCKANNIYEEEQTIDKQQEQFGISSYLSEAQKYNDKIDFSSIFKDSMTGKFDNNKILKIITSSFQENIKQSLLTVEGIIIIVIVNSVLKAISENLGNDSVSKIAYYIQYILIVTLIMTNFSTAIMEIKQTVKELTNFTTILIPLLTTLIIATGNITTSSVIEPILLSLITFISSFITNVLIPLLLVGTSLGIISKISDNIQVSKLSKFFSKGSVWVLTTVLGLFIGLASLEGGLTSNVDNITKKAGKSVISLAIPVVGSALGDAIDTIVGYTNVIKNATGLVGIFVISSICLKPIINLASLTLVYKLGTALCEPVADKKIVEIIDEISNVFKILLAIVFTITCMIVIGIALVIKITS